MKKSMLNDWNQAINRENRVRRGSWGAEVFNLRKIADGNPARGQAGATPVTQSTAKILCEDVILLFRNG